MPCRTWVLTGNRRKEPWAWTYLTVHKTADTCTIMPKLFLQDKKDNLWCAVMRNCRTKLSACGLGQNSLNMMGLPVIILALQCIQAAQFFLRPIADFSTRALDNRLSPFTYASAHGLWTTDYLPSPMLQHMGFEQIISLYLCCTPTAYM